MNLGLDDFKDNIIPGVLFNELSVGIRYVMLERDDVQPGTVITRELVITNGTILDTHCGYKFESIDTIITELGRKCLVQHFYEVTFPDDSSVFYGAHALVADKLIVGDKRHITSLPYLKDPAFMAKFKTIIWVRPTFPELFDESYDVISESMFTEMDVLNDPEIVKDVKLTKSEQLKIIRWNPDTLYYIDDPCEEALIAMCKIDLDTIKDYIGNYVTNITDNVKREIAIYDFKFLVDRYHILPRDLVLRAMRTNLEYLLHLEISKDVALELVKENPAAVLYINLADDEVKLEAIKKDPKLIKWFKSITVDMLMVASGEDPEMFKQCQQNRPDVAIKLLEIRGDLIKFLSPENQTEDLCLVAVRSDPDAIKHIAKDKLTESIRLTAVQTSPNAIVHIDDPSEDVCVEVVSRLPGLLKEIKNQTPLICQTAVNKAPLAIRFVTNQTHDLCLSAVSRDPNAIKYINNIIPELICLAVHKDPTIINEIETKNLDLQLCLSCAYLNPDSMDHIKDDNLKFDCMLEFMQMITLVQ
jgi:hypothetical protein